MSAVEAGGDQPETEAVADESQSDDPAPEPEPDADISDGDTQAVADAVDSDSVLSNEPDAGVAEVEPAQLDEQPEPAHEPVVDIESLDEQLAEATDGLIAADDSTEPTQPEPTQPEPTEPEPTQAQHAASASATPDDAPAESDEAVAAEPADEPIADETPAVAAPKAKSSAKPSASKSHKANAAAQRIMTVARAGFAHAEPVALRGAVLVSSPLASRPKIVRDTVGWIGLWTLFLAISVWFTLAFLRSSTPPEVDAEPTALAEPE